MMKGYSMSPSKRRNQHEKNNVSNPKTHHSKQHTQTQQGYSKELLYPLQNMILFGGSNSISETFGICRSYNTSSTNNDSDNESAIVSLEDSSSTGSVLKPQDDDVIDGVGSKNQISIDMSTIKFDKIVSNLDNINVVNKNSADILRQNLMPPSPQTLDANSINFAEEDNVRDKTSSQVPLSPSPTYRRSSSSSKGNNEKSVSNLTVKYNELNLESSIEKSKITQRLNDPNTSTRGNNSVSEYAEDPTSHHLLYPPLRIGIAKSYYTSSVTDTNELTIKSMTPPPSPKIQRMKPFGSGQYSFNIEDHELDYVSGPHVIAFCHGFQGSPHDMKLLANIVQAELESVRVN